MAMRRPTHLFLSYASENGTFSDWLALKLVAEGYEVWYDRMKLLGGESYPNDIDSAIKNQSFRVLGLLSEHSVSKANPVKERTLALLIGRERHLKDFYIPLNVDGLEPHELPWMTSDLTFIPFHRGWYQGFVGLLKKLRSINTPISETARQRVIQWFEQTDSPLRRPEQVWTNLVPVLEIPDTIFLYSVPALVEPKDLDKDWPVFPQDPALVWSFTGPPPSVSRGTVLVKKIEWRTDLNPGGLNPSSIVTGLIRRYVESHCLGLGLQKSSTGRLYFPKLLMSDDRLEFTNYNGKKTYVKSVGQRTFNTMIDNKYEAEIARYHLSPNFKPMLKILGTPFLRIGIGVHWTDQDGNELPALKANRRRKALCKKWWNYEWYARVTAVATWFASGNEILSLCETKTGNLKIGTKLAKLESPSSLDESEVPDESEDSPEILDEEEDEN